MAAERTIAELAYHLWLARGSPIGSPELDWREAERQVTGKTSAVPAQVSEEGTAYPSGSEGAIGS